ncbi:hypothetical protein HYG81_18775 [Natrinema zhouii]|uniref:hypothetical protein n=1 Tax=Natrinema zhouii TaxID=1710539 RepID=UPI001CFFFA57|nr:hypothetical protein [Natrinema zhouii]UHQ97903.1 hypothetical protein HYG81_18775 [Natrinema zhouii]
MGTVGEAEAMVPETEVIDLWLSIETPVTLLVTVPTLWLAFSGDVVANRLVCIAELTTGHVDIQVTFSPSRMTCVI